MRKYRVVVPLTLGLSLMFGSGFAADKTSIAVVDFGISGVSEEVSQAATQKFRDILAQNQ